MTMRMIGAYPGDESSSFFKLVYLTKEGKLMEIEYTPADGKFGDWRDVVPPPMPNGGTEKKPKPRGAYNVERISKEELEKLYLKEKRSVDAVAEIKGYSPSGIRKMMIDYGIPIRSRGQASHSEKWKESKEFKKKFPGPPVKSLKDMAPEERAKVIRECEFKRVAQKPATNRRQSFSEIETE